MPTVEPQAPQVTPQNEALNFARMRVLNRYAPAGNYHPPAKESKRISVSRLVSKTAMEYATLELDSDDEVDPYYSFKGNTLGNEALADVPIKELALYVPIPDTDWMLTGHCDGLDVVGEFIVIHEHKAYGKPNRRKIELARRQASLYLSMFWRQYAGGQNLFHAAAWHGGQPHTFPVGLKPGGLVISIAPEVAPPISQTYAQDEVTCSGTLEFYLLKAAAVAQTLMTGDSSHCKKWDESQAGLAEAKTNMQEAPADEEKAEALMRRYREVSEIDSGLYAEKEEIKAQIKQWLAHNNGARKLTAGAYTASIIDVRESTVQRKASTQLRITG